MAIDAVVKKWGNSFGVVLPKDFVNETRLKENDKVSVVIIKKANLRNIFGTLKTKQSGQEFKDMVKAGW